MRSRQYGNGLNTEHCRHGGSSQNQGGKSWEVCRTMKPNRSKFSVLGAEFCSGDPFRHRRLRSDGRHRGRIREFHPRRHRALCPPYAGDRRRNRVRLPDPLQYTHVVGDRGAAHIENPAEFGIRNLHVAGLAAKLHGGKRVHRHAGCSDWMAFRLESARGIDRERAAFLSESIANCARVFAFPHEPHGFIFDEFRDGEAIVGFHEREVGKFDAGRRKCPRPSLAATLEFQNVALRHRQEILHIAGGTEDHGFFHRQRGFDIGEHQCRRAVGDRRAIGALQGTGHIRIFFTFAAAEIESEVLAQLRIGIRDSVLVILGGDHGERVRLVAVFLKIQRRDPAENSREAARDVGLLAHIRRLEEIAADVGRGRRGHLLSPDHEHNAGRAGLDRPYALMHRGGPGRACVLDTGRGLETQIRRGLEHQGGGKILRRKTGVEVTEQDFIDICRRNAGVIERGVRGADYQAFHRFVIKPAEGRMSPADDTRRHGTLLYRDPDVLFQTFRRKHNPGGNPCQHLCLCLPKWGKSPSSANASKTNGPHIVTLSQKLLVVPASALALAAGAGFALTALDVRPVRADALLLVDVDSGKVIDEQNSTYPWYPASVTKLMTTYVTFKAVRDGRISFDSVFTVSPTAVAQQPSKMGFKSGTRITVDNALKMLLVHSANDMAVVLAEGVSGSIEKFSDEMNAAASRLGMTQTSYVNPNGLPADEQITSARDLAILARALIREFPEYDSYWHIASIRLGKRIYRNTNKLIDAYPGTDGMKTGFICASGFNLVATATRGNKRLIAVVLGATSSTGRAVKAAQLFERGFGAAPLSWLMPSLGTVDSLVPIAATPPDLHEDICGDHRRRHATEDGEEGGEAGTAAAGADDPGQRSFLQSSLRGVMARGSAALTSGLAAAIPPVEVYTGPARN